jgi:hypothetical protein
MPYPTLVQLQTTIEEAETLAAKLAAELPPDTDPTEPPPHDGDFIVVPPDHAKLQPALDVAKPGQTIVLAKGFTYVPQGATGYRWKPRDGLTSAKRVTLVSEGWRSKGEKFAGLVNRDDADRMAFIQAKTSHVWGLEVQNKVPDGPAAGYLTFQGMGFKAATNGAGAPLVIGDDKATDAALLARGVRVNQVLILGDPAKGSVRGIEANGTDIDITQTWIDDAFSSSKDSQGISAWRGGIRVHVQYSYVCAGSENILAGGVPVPDGDFAPYDWIVEDCILHKPERWRTDGKVRRVKNLFELKHGAGFKVRRNLMVGCWKNSQNGIAVLLHYTTNGSCRACIGLVDIEFDDNVILNSAGGIGFQGYSWNFDSDNGARLQRARARGNYLSLGSYRPFGIFNFKGRHDIAIERNAVYHSNEKILEGDYGHAWEGDPPQRVPGGPMQGLGFKGNAFNTWSAETVPDRRYGITLPNSKHYGTGLAEAVTADLEVSGNVIGDIPATTLARLNTLKAGGAMNLHGTRADLDKWLHVDTLDLAKLPAGVGPDPAKIAAVLALRRYLPEP